MYLLLPLLLACQAEVTPLWSDVGDPAGENDASAGLTVDAEGSLYTLATFQDAPLVQRAVLRKFDPAGELVWSRDHLPAGFLDGTQGRDIELMPQGGVVIVGDGLGSNSDGFVAAYNEFGTLLWNTVVPLGVSTTLTMSEVGVDTDGQVYATGLFTTPSSPRTGTRLVSLANDGLQLWSWALTPVSGDSVLTGLEIGPGGTAYTYGYQDGLDGERRAFVRSTAKSGFIAWEHAEGDSSAGSLDYFSDLKISPQGEPILAGTYGLSASSIGVPYMVIKQLSVLTGSETWQRGWVGQNLNGARGSGLLINSLGFPVILGEAVGTIGVPGNAFLRLYDPAGVFLGTYTWLSQEGGDASYEVGEFLDDLRFVVSGLAGDSADNTRVVTQGYDIFGGLQWTEFRGESIPQGAFAVKLAVAPGDDIYQVATVTEGDSFNWDVDTCRIGDGPMPYCATQINSLGCAPVMSATGVASVSAPTGMLLTGEQLLANQFAILIYGRSGPNALPFGGGLLCVAAPIVRTPVQGTGGASGCNGVASLDFNAWLTAGNDPAVSAGDQVWAQCWSRDPGAPSGFNLTNGVTFVVQP